MQTESITEEIDLHQKKDSDKGSLQTLYVDFLLDNMTDKIQTVCFCRWLQFKNGNQQSG